MAGNNPFLNAIEPYLSIPDFKRDFNYIAQISADIWQDSAAHEDLQLMQDVERFLAPSSLHTPNNERRLYVTLGYLVPVIIVHNPNHDTLHRVPGYGVTEYSQDYEQRFFAQRKQGAILWSFSGVSFSVDLLSTVSLASLFLAFSNCNQVVVAPELGKGSEGGQPPANVIPFHKRP